jgi:starch phosphorylase
VGRAVARLYAEALGEDWPELLTEPEVWATIDELPDESVWQAHHSQKQLTLRRLRAILMEQAARHGASPEELRRIDDQLPADRLTIVFARRFATYKRAGLLFRDIDRLTRLLTDPERPVQLIFSGKAHPADREGQGLIRWVVELARSEALRGHIYFIENYSMQLGRWLVTGADVWMNAPRPPLEASGTSGMKSAMNGGLNLSVLDGWWIEGYDGDNGWGFEGDDDERDAATLFDLLEHQVVPEYFERDDAGVPVAWVAHMKRAMAGITPAFSTQRMVAEYAERMYLPLAGVARVGAPSKG